MPENSKVQTNQSSRGIIHVSVIRVLEEQEDKCDEESIVKRIINKKIIRIQDYRHQEAQRIPA